MKSVQTSSGPPPAPDKGRRNIPMGVSLFNPEGIFRLLCDIFSPLRISVKLIIPLALLASFTASANWYPMQYHIERTFLSISFFQSLLISLLTANLFSKILLGMTMAYFQVDSREFGIRLLFGVIPRFWIDRRPEQRLSFRKQRICSTAPLLTKLFMFAFGLMMWAITRRSGSGLSELFLVLSVTGIGAFLFTANPLWPADGYKWLAAYLERPNLRQQSLRVTAMILRGRKLPEGLGAGERWALLIYALAAVGFTATIIFMALRTAAFALEQELQGGGMVIFCILVAMFILFIVSLRSKKGGKPAVVDVSKAQRRAKQKRKAKSFPASLPARAPVPQIYSDQPARALPKDAEHRDMSDKRNKAEGADPDAQPDVNQELDALFKVGDGDATGTQDDFFTDAPMPSKAGLDDVLSGGGDDDASLLDELEDILEQADADTGGHLDDILGPAKVPEPEIAEEVVVPAPEPAPEDEDDPDLAELDPLVEAAEEAAVDMPEGEDPMDALNAVLAADIEEAELDGDPIMSELEALLGDVTPEALDDLEPEPKPKTAAPELIDTPPEGLPVLPVAPAPVPAAAPAPEPAPSAQKDAAPDTAEPDEETLLFPEQDELGDMDEWNPEEDLATMWEGGAVDPKHEQRTAEDDAALEALLSAPIDEEKPPLKAGLPVKAQSRALQRRDPEPDPDALMVPTAAPAATGDLDRVLRMGTRRPSGRRRWLVRFIWMALLGGLLYVAFLPYAFEVGGEFTVQPGEISQVRARTDGEIIELRVRQGDWVEKGQVMAVLSNWDELRDIAVREAEIAKLEAHMETLTLGARPEEIALAEQAVTGAEVKLDIAKRNYDRQETLFNSGTISQVALDQAKGAVALAVSELKNAETQLDLINSGARESEIAAARADIARNQEDLSFAQQQLENTNIRAVTDGRIVSSFEEVPVGAYLTVGGLFAELEDNRVVYASIDVPETEIDEVEIGATAELKLWSDSGDPIFGTVLRIAPKAEEREFGQVIPVTVEVPNEDGRLATSLTGFGKVGASERPVWAAFTRLIVRFFQVELWSWVP